MKCSEDLFSGTRFLVSVDEWGSRAVLTQDGRAVEYFFERRGRPVVVGNIYLGRVRTVHKGLSSAFVDVGLERNGFLASDTLVSHEAGELDSPPRPIREGETVVAQVTRAPRGRKGPRMTLRVSIPGRYLVLVPDTHLTGVSKRLAEEDRERIRELVEAICPPGYGLIARTLACEATRDDLERELLWLVEQWQTVRALAARKKPPCLVYREPELPLRLARDLVSVETVEVVVDDAPTMGQLRNYLARYSPELARKVRLHTGSKPLFDEMGIEKQLERMRQRHVWLPSGGYIAIDRTEALTTIDVNSGKAATGKGLKELAYRTNVEAAREIPRQVRLRDISGIIVIDFIDMGDHERAAQVEEELRRGFATDRGNVRVLGMSPIGLVEITRSSATNSERDYFLQPCPHCGGQGVVVSDDEAVVGALRRLKRELPELPGGHVYLRVSDRLFGLFSSEFSGELKRLLAVTGRTVTLLPDATLGDTEFAVDYLSAGEAAPRPRVVERAPAGGVEGGGSGAAPGLAGEAVADSRAESRGREGDGP